LKIYSVFPVHGFQTLSSSYWIFLWVCLLEETALAAKLAFLTSWRCRGWAASFPGVRL